MHNFSRHVLTCHFHHTWATKVLFFSVTAHKRHAKHEDIEQKTRQYARAVWSTFAEIHSGYPTRFIAVGVIIHWGYWNFRLEFVMPYISQHTRDVPNLSCYCDLITAFIGFPFALLFTCTFTECVT